MKRLFWPVVLLFGVVLTILIWADVIPARYVLAPLLGLFIYLFGVASLGSFRRGMAAVPDGPPEPVDTRTQRITYWCGGCGAELLLLVRGAPVPPRHCGERMTERHEVAHELR